MGFDFNSTIRVVGEVPANTRQMVFDAILKGEDWWLENSDKEQTFITIVGRNCTETELTSFFEPIAAEHGVTLEVDHEDDMGYERYTFYVGKDGATNQMADAYEEAINALHRLVSWRKNHKDLLPDVLKLLAERKVDIDILPARFKK